MRSPLSGDYAELGRMVPEKVAAFSASGTAGMQALMALQAGYVAPAQELGALSLRGRPPTLFELAALSERSSMHALSALETGAKMGRDVVAPLHKAATGNAKRLRKTPLRVSRSENVPPLPPAQPDAPAKLAFADLRKRHPGLVETPTPRLGIRDDTASCRSPAFAGWRGENGGQPVRQKIPRNRFRLPAPFSGVPLPTSSRDCPFVVRCAAAGLAARIGPH
eukprot:gene37573-45117_t